MFVKNNTRIHNYLNTIFFFLSISYNKIPNRSKVFLKFISLTCFVISRFTTLMDKRVYFNNIRLYTAWELVICLGCYNFTGISIDWLFFFSRPFMKNIWFRYVWKWKTRSRSGKNGRGAMGEREAEEDRNSWTDYSTVPMATSQSGGTTKSVLVPLG